MVVLTSKRSVNVDCLDITGEFSESDKSLIHGLPETDFQYLPGELRFLCLGGL